MWEWQFIYCKFIIRQEGKYINHQNIFMNTPLHQAVVANNLQLVKVLIDKGGDKTLKNSSNETPLHCAQRLHRFTIVNYLS